MHPIQLAIVWHQHQPYYPDDVGGENPMPWVRLHATKDYWGMAMQLKEVPEFHATINLVPSLLVQLLGYLEHGHEDEHLRISRAPADALAEADLHYLLDNFFMVHPDHMIRPYPRYHELYQMRGVGVDSAERAAKRFNKRDLLDLQCWSNLTWMHPIAFEQDADLADLRRKGRHFSEADKSAILEKQMSLLGEVIPLHRELAESGQVELTTTPFYHPILPLLWDKKLARQAMPHVNLPAHLEPYPEDGERHIKAAVAQHEKLFGAKPVGMWPSEGSVCQAMVPAVAGAGIEWIATDEEILSASTEGRVSRDAQGYLRNPELLYRPWRVEERGQSVQMVFRDHAMSDQIGFHYQRYEPAAAVDDFIGKLEAIGRATAASAAQRPTLVSIILDGENCWEYYADGGRNFLRGLYERVAAHPQIKSTTVGDHVREHPATDKLGHLFSGSWISHNFGIWIGHPECNQAWDLLYDTRQRLLAASKKKGKRGDNLDAAWRELMIAEGSDWFWWFGDSHTSAQDAVFDRLFRKHLQNVYELLGDEAPAELMRPISQSHRAAAAHSQPTSLLTVKIDGRRTYFEWINAGQLLCGGSRGAMSMVQESRLDSVWFGFDEEYLFLRLDARGGPARERLAELDELRFTFLKPDGYELIVEQPGSHTPAVKLLRRGAPALDGGAEAACDQILEIALPLRALKVTTDDALQFRFDVIEQGQPVERIPAEGAIETVVPSPEFELMMWQA